MSDIKSDEEPVAAQIEVTHEVFEELTNRFSDQIEGRLDVADRFLIIHEAMAEANAASLVAVSRMIETLLPLVSKAEIELQSKRIDTLMSLFVAETPRHRVDDALERDNARLRADYLVHTPLLTAQQIHELAGGKSRNKSEPASRWKRSGKAFAVPNKGIDLYPAFQFEDGAPRAIIKTILDSLPGQMTPWQIAFWFQSSNGWLDGDAPVERLNDTDAVLRAARQLSEPSIG